MLLLLLLPSAFVLLPWTGAERIIGGWEVKPHSRPYMAYLKIEYWSHCSNCGGFLIRPDAVLSAAHCVDKGPERITVFLGAHNVSVREPSQKKIIVKQWVIHPKYSRAGFQNDIALLKLPSKAEISENVDVISFASSNERVAAGEKCMVAGWGRTSAEGRRSDVMREVDLKVQKDKICETKFDKYNYKSMICVGDDKGKKASCNGDSGGPLICKGKAHGIVSRGRKDSLFPKVYTRVSYFEPWIREQLKRFALQELPGSIL